MKLRILVKRKGIVRVTKSSICVNCLTIRALSIILEQSQEGVAAFFCSSCLYFINFGACMELV